MNKNKLNRVAVLAWIICIGGCASYHNHVNPMEKVAEVSQLVHGQNATEYRQSEMIAAGIGALGNQAAAGYQDRLEADLQRTIHGSGIVIRREGNVLRLSLPARTTFAEKGAELNLGLYSALDQVAKVLADYRQTMIEVIGYGDAQQALNQRLPEQRAFEISSYLVARELRHERFEIVGLKRRSPVQAEIRLLPLQRTVSMQLRGREHVLVNTNGFVAL